MNLPSRWQAPLRVLFSFLVLSCFSSVPAQEAGASGGTPRAETPAAQTPPAATTVASKIVAATLYSSQARVVRELESPATAGTQEVRVGPLPASVIDSSVQVEGASHLRVLGVRIERDSGEEQASPEFLELEARSQQLHRQIAALERQRAVARDRFQRYLNVRVAAPPRSSEAPNPVKIQPDSWKVFLEVVREGLVEALGADEAVAGDLYPLRVERARLAQEMAQLAVPDRDTETRAIVTVQNTTGEPGTLRVSYRVPRAFWYPSYALHIDPATHKLRIALYAVVHQRTGEAWPEIPYQFSSSIPESGAGLPDLHAQHITRQRYEDRPMVSGAPKRSYDSRASASRQGLAVATPAVPAEFADESLELEKLEMSHDDADNFDTFAKRQSERPSARPSARRARKKSKRGSARSGQSGESYFGRVGSESNALGELDRALQFKDLQAPGASSRRHDDRRNFVGVPGGVVLPIDSARGFLATWTSLQSEAVPSDGAPHRLLIGNLELTYGEQRTLVPELSTQVYRRLKASLTGDHPLLAGHGAVFFGDAYLGTAYLATTAPGEEITVDLGVDDRLRVKRETFDGEQDTGVFSKSTVYSTRVELQIENFRDAPVTIDVWERVPFTEQERISVALDARATRPKLAEVQEHSGLVKWSIQVAPGGKQELQLAYQIDAPRDFQLTRSEDPSRLAEGSQK